MAGHPNRAEIDLSAVGHNVEVLAATARPAQVCTVVKADGYGHGAVAVGRTALEAGATWLAVAHPMEGRALRAGGIGAPVLVLSEPRPEAMPDAVAADLRLTVSGDVGVDAAAAAARAAGTVARLHLKVDTGMHRAGCDPADALSLAQRIDGSPHLELEAVWSHCAVADEPENPFTALQVERLDEVLATLAAAGLQPPLRHQANSAATLAHPATRRDMVRCGIATYGISPAPALDGRADLRPALHLVSEVAFVRHVEPGEAASYGLLRTFDRPTSLATVPIGYADGLPRVLWERGEVLIGGQRHPFAGVITMDQSVIDVGDAEVVPGDPVVLLGRQGDQEITAAEVAERAGTIAYEVVSRIGPRVPRVYLPPDGP
jgi:alanine racemase